MLWIVVLAALLAGVVAINVALLQLNVRLDALSQERAKLRSANAALAAELSSASDPFELETLARDQLGFTRATPDQMLYVDIGAR